MSTISLPDEIALDIAQRLDARDLCVMSMLSRRFHLVARDPRLWRRLFQRDFPNLFIAPPGRLSAYDALAVDDWPIEARAMYECASAGPHGLPIPSPVDAGLPPPFARALVSGKDWSWLYGAWAGALRSHRRGKPICIGASSPTQGYRVQVNMPKDRSRVSRWIEGAPGWEVIRSAESDKYVISWFSLTHLHGGSCSWRGYGPCAIKAADGPPDAETVEVYEMGQGARRVKFTYTDPGRTTLVRNHYANGDVQVIRYGRRERDRTGVEFTCSPQCPDPDFAGQRLDCTWRVHRVPDGSPYCEPILLPIHPSPDAPRFWRYVLLGHIGWTDAERQYALQCAGFPCVARDTVRAVGALLGGASTVSVRD
ncbi:F-box domain containing protein [Pandoravirus quercus]|uniref:F-box domain containing protein n=1 Tax=Pandoravirus quercus TaxID=2107709 RepID=A0A2U7UA98_9VIRU|nr:F-box domain containing protein [Pandoravirus quercus]AVK75378.1 F-box domain containing protein [Pandoravirus quercus]